MRRPAGIVLDAVSMRYPTPAGLVHALEGISLEVAPAGSVAITGPSGCGKSTLLALMAGLDVPTAGRVRVGGEELSSLPEPRRARLRRHALGLLFQSDNLLPFLTAVENVGLQLALHDPVEDDRRCRELLGELGLAEQADRLPDQLSGGQRQRVAVARALIHRPCVILADEPTGALDARSSEIVIDLLLAARSELDATLAIVTHDADVARRMERTFELHDGRLADEILAGHAR